ncbi:MAG: alpha/beta fold hydrolase [Chthoniobacteraceae bacterium]
MKTKSILFLAAALGVASSITSSWAQERGRKAQAPEGLVRNWLSQQDKDGDGKISESEATGLMKSNFARNDANKNGVLDRAELDALSARLGRTARPGTRTDNAAPRRQQSISTEQLLARATPDITIVPDIAYREGHDRAWKLDLVMPKERGDKPRPGIVFVHGGGWRSGDKRTGSFLNGAIEYAKKGYVCITINYRLIDEGPFPACVEDVKNAVRWFRANAEKSNLDPARIGGYGNSAGAHLVAMLGLVKKDAGLEGDGPYQDQSSLLQAVCASATPTDFKLFGGGRSSTGGLLAGDEATAEERSRKASPISYVAKDAPPFLLIHGTTDTTVNVKHSDTFVEALKAAGAKDVTYIRIEGSGHGVFNEHSAKTGPAMEEFFKRTLGAK